MYHIVNIIRNVKGYIYGIAITFAFFGISFAQVCGDSNKESPEECDDGNTIANDGCDALCFREYGWTCNEPVSSFSGLVLSDLDGLGSRVFDADGQGATETENSGIGILNIENDAMGIPYALNFGVLTTSDDDFIGIVLGYEDGEIDSTTGDYLLYDWKQGTQTYAPYGGLASAGSALSHVQGVTTTNLWSHTGPSTELMRGTTNGSVGWVDNQMYQLDILYTSTSLKIRIDGVIDVDVVPSDFGSRFSSGFFPFGGIGFYTFSQAQARFEINEVSSLSTCYVECGDSETGPGEECDDGNTVSGDYCSAICKTEYCWDDAPLNDTSMNLVVTELSSTNIVGTSDQVNSDLTLCFEDTAGTRDIIYLTTDISGGFSYSLNLAPYASDWVNIGVMLHDENGLDIDHHSLILLK